MAIRGFNIEITYKMSSKAATHFARWIAGSNVMRNQRIEESLELIRADKGSDIDQKYAGIKAKPELSFLKEIPPQILRNAASMLFSDINACRSGLRKFPKPKGRNRKRSCVVTKEMFILEPLNEGRALLTFYEKASKKPARMFSIKLDYEPDQLAKQFRISRQGRRFYLSGSYNDGVESATNEELLKGFVAQSLSDDELLSQITGIDRGVKLPIATSDGLRKAYSPETTERLKRLVQKKARYQRILARKKRQNNNKNTRRVESNEQQKLADKIANFDAKTARIRHDFLHQTSKEVVLSAKSIIALEDLKLKNMTKRAKPKRGKHGRGYARNNANAKSSLNRSLLNVALGKLGDFIKYKANDYGKAVVEVSPAGTSQTCHMCGEKNTIRPQQDTLICLNGCGTFHADDNASIVVAQRAVPYIQESTFAQKAKTRKKTAVRKKAVTPPLGSELASTEKSGELETASTDVSLVCSRTQADVRPSSTASLVQRNSLTTMDASVTGVLETR